jgi:hypothetical protein
VKETRSVLKTNCRDSLDHMQPMWFRSFRGELSRVVNYCRGVQKIQGEFRCIFRARRNKRCRPPPARCYHFAGRGVSGRRGANVAERPTPAARCLKFICAKLSLAPPELRMICLQRQLIV